MTTVFEVLSVQPRRDGTHRKRQLGDSALVLSQLRTHHPPRKPHLTLKIFREARALADDIGVSSWEHYYRTYNKMADRLANIAMDTKASIQVHASAETGVVKKATAFLDNDVNHWLEASHAEYHEPQGPAMTPRNLIISRQDIARRRARLSEDKSYQEFNVEVATVTLLPADRIY